MQPQLAVYDPQEEETRRRIAAARAAGWDEGLIQRNAMIDRATRAQQQQQAAPAAQEQPRVGGAKRFLINAAAMGGSIGAGVLGAAFAAPTFGASVAGAFGAGAGIEALRRRALGEDQSLKSSLIEGGLAALPGVAKGVGMGIRAAKGAAQTAKTSMSMKALARKAAQSGATATPTASRTLEGSNALTSMRPAAKGFTSSLDAQKYAKFDDFYKDYGTFFKEQGFTRGDANKIFQAAQRTPMGGLSTPAGGAVGLRPSASIQAQIETAHNAGNRALEGKLIEQLPAAEQNAMRSALGITTPEVAAKAAPQSVLQTAGQAFKSKPGAISGRAIKGGENLKAQARGVVPGLKPQGAGERLLPADATKINQTLNSVGAKGAVPRQLRTVEAAQQKALGQIDKEIDQFGNVVLSPTARANIARKINMNLSGTNAIHNITPQQRALITELEGTIKSTQTLKGQEQLRRSLDTYINYARNPATADPNLERIYRAARQGIDSAISAATPGLKAAKTQYAALEAAKDALIMNTPATLRQAGGRGLIGTLMSGSAAQKGLDVAGRTLGTAGKIASLPAVKVGVTQQVGRTLLKPPDENVGAIGMDGLQLGETGLMEPGMPPGEMGDDPALIQQMLQQGASEDEILAALSGQDPMQNMGGGMGAAGGGLGGGALAGLSRSSAELFNDALATAQSGNFEGAKLLMALSSQAAELEKSGGATAKLDATSKKAAAAGQNALSVVDQIEKAYSRVGGAQGAIVGTARNIGGKVRADQNANFYNSQKLGFLSRIARAFGEVGTLAEGDVTRAANLMPDLADTPENAAAKLAALRELIGEARDRALAGGGASFGETPTDQGLDLTQLGL